MNAKNGQQKLPRALSLRRARAVVERVQGSRIWCRLFLGRCGPAAVAINEELLGGVAKYVVLLDRGPRNGLPREWSGHVALLHQGKLLDYMGGLSWEEFAYWNGRAEDPSSKPAILVDVSRRDVEREFVRPCCACDWTSVARGCLKRARKKVLEEARR